MQSELVLGIIGASANRGWARDSHVPAVQRLSGLSLGAVASGTQAKSDAAAKAFGARSAYENSFDLLGDSAIDLVSICVKVPDHRDLVLAAIQAGKHIYCEWPLGRSLAETTELATAAEAAGVHVAVGLQTRMNPVLREARTLLRNDAIGDVLSARIISSTIAFGSEVDAAMLFAEDAANGATLVSIQGAHTIDAAIAVLGELKSATALLSTQYPQVTFADKPGVQQRHTADHLLVQSEIANGGVLAIEVAGGRPSNDITFSFHITGTAGDLVLRGGAIRGFQSGTLQLIFNDEVQSVDEGELSAMPESAMNVAGIYAALRDDINAGTYTVPDFADAVQLTKLMDDLALSSLDGCRKSAASWPAE